MQPWLRAQDEPPTLVQPQVERRLRQGLQLTAALALVREMGLHLRLQLAPEASQRLALVLWRSPAAAVPQQARAAVSRAGPVQAKVQARLQAQEPTLTHWSSPEV